MAGVAPATAADGFDHLRDWLNRGFAGDMEYMHRHGNARQHPSSILPDVRTVIMVGMNYFPGPVGQISNLMRTEEPPPRFAGRVARYARGKDYHNVVRERLYELLKWIQDLLPSCRGRPVVDTAPLLERDFARRAGLGWFGKNTMLLNKRLGSYFFLGALLLDAQLQPDPPQTNGHCGTCTACLDACPTGAFPEPGKLDARRCISYLTIELRAPIPEELREGVGDWLFGCDVCQEVCPWNRKTPSARPTAWPARHDLAALDAAELLSLSAEDFRSRFQETALARPKRRGLLRNAAIVLGNRGDPAALPALQKALADPEALVREAAQWAIAQIESKNNLVRLKKIVPNQELPQGVEHHGENMQRLPKNHSGRSGVLPALPGECG